MCGICLALIHANGNESNSAAVFETFLAESGLGDSLRRRGPDSFGFCSKTVDANHTLHGAASVLHMRGDDALVCQPVTSEDGSFLLYNGEIYEGLQEVEKNTRCSDTTVLFETLLRLTAADMIADAFLNIFDSLQGPYAFAFYHATQKRLWFGRDAFGRRSLLYSASRNAFSSDVIWQFLLSSVSIPKNDFSPHLWHELPAGYIFSLDFNKSTFSLTAYRLRPASTADELDHLQSVFGAENFILAERESEELKNLFSLNRDFSREHLIDFTPNTAPEVFEMHFEKCFEKEIDGFLHHLRNSVQKRLVCVAERHAKFALLFSGGVDSLLLAALIAQEPLRHPLDLINVAFVGAEKCVQAPDRITGLAAFDELQRLYPHTSKWTFVHVDVNASDLKAWRRERIADLVRPADTVLDDSIGCVLWFASRGEGVHSGSTPREKSSYCSSSRILFLGTGADELLAGYSRHRVRFNESGLPGLAEELEMELKRIGTRNLARDDRIIADNGRESRLPYLDETFVKYLNSLPLHAKFDLRLGRGVGEKFILRMALKRLGFTAAFYRLPKRAMQFGSRLAKAENRKEKGNDKCTRLISDVDN